MYEFFSDVDTFDTSMAAQALPAVEAIVRDYNLDISYIHFIFTDDEQLLGINRQFLNHDYFTDIITFNYAENKSPIEGELYISIDRVKENASDLGIKTEDELFRVMLHGVIHLAGFEDGTDEERKVMQSLEDKYVSMVSSTWNVQQNIKNV